MASDVDSSQLASLSPEQRALFDQLTVKSEDNTYQTTAEIKQTLDLQKLDSSQIAKIIRNLRDTSIIDRLQSLIDQALIHDIWTETQRSVLTDINAMIQQGIPLRSSKGKSLAYTAISARLGLGPGYCQKFLNTVLPHKLKKVGVVI